MWLEPGKAGFCGGSFVIDRTSLRAYQRNFNQVPIGLKRSHEGETTATAGKEESQEA